MTDKKYLKTRLDHHPLGTAVTGTAGSTPDVLAIVRDVIDTIRKDGDIAVRKYFEKFDKWSPRAFRLSKSEIDKAIAACPKQTIDDIKNVQRNVRAFAEAQRKSITDFELEIRPGVADVQTVVGCTPPILGKIPNATVAAMYYAGADEIWVLGGVQAVAAMACGTETMPKVYFIAGPGNAFVAEVKRQMFGEVGIDIFAGQTEVLVGALLSQAERGPDTPAVLITTSEKVGTESIKMVDKMLEMLPTATLAGTSWKTFGEAIAVPTLEEAFKLANEYASEHVQVLTRHPREALEKMQNSGALFLGEKTCVSYGDKAIFCLLVVNRLTLLGDRHKSRPAHSKSSEIYGWIMGR
ncbi:hypothetical protein HO173_004773 [Letharia columbiana]|uniref:Histidinol dehydrogenase n=1 Tax=Letharia columbiana TaxID=112416 RepID=A0A8H6FYV3_9LECA|nr:uncharacterized protein HO173_004773 [Letharia columbiana]KAF6237304.1 hypothetical protein HO173_004773 [Letharia columbiana]